MKVLLWKLTQDQRRGYDTFDSCIVAATTEEEAKLVHPYYYMWGDSCWNRDVWASDPEYVKAEPIGVAKPSIKAGTVVLASFNAG